jgi:hypothetical protein
MAENRDDERSKRRKKSKVYVSTSKVEAAAIDVIRLIDLKLFRFRWQWKHSKYLLIEKFATFCVTEEAFSQSFKDMKSHFIFRNLDKPGIVIESRIRLLVYLED